MMQLDMYVHYKPCLITKVYEICEREKSCMRTEYNVLII